MKKIALVLAALLTAGTSFLAADEVPSSDTKVVFQQGQPAGSIKKVTIALKAENLVINRTEEENISIRIDSNYMTAVPQVSFDSKSIKIEQKDKKSVKLQNRICIVTLSLPKDLKLQEVKIGGDTSDIILTDANIQKLSVITGDKGAITLSGINGQSLELKSEKGDVDLSDIEMDKDFKLISADGAVSLKNLEAADFTLETEKGKVSAEGLKAKKVSVNTDKADAKISFDTMFEKDSVIYVSSGKAEVELPSNAVLWTAGSVDKGRFRSDFTEDSKGSLLTIKVGGGDLQIQKK